MIEVFLFLLAMAGVVFLAEWAGTIIGKIVSVRRAEKAGIDLGEGPAIVKYDRMVALLEELEK